PFREVSSESSSPAECSGWRSHSRRLSAVKWRANPRVVLGCRVAISITCPSCKSHILLPATFGGGRVRCTNARCGHVLKVAPAGAPVPRPGASLPPLPESHPPLLQKVKATDIASSPGFYAGAAAFVFVYGVVLFAVLSERKRHPPPVVAEPEPPYVASTVRPNPPPAV